MTITSFIIGPIKDGIRKDVKPFAIPEDAFESLKNCYQFRGRVVKRSGYTLLGNLDNGTPCMGLKTFEKFGVNTDALIAFDTTNSYLYNGSTFLVQPFIRGDGVTTTNAVWSGTDYQFFWTANYAGALWATNSKPGLPGYTITAFTLTNGLTGTAAIVSVTAPGNTFIVGDYVYFLNVLGAPAANNLMYGQVTIAGATFTVQSLDINGSAFVNGVATSGVAISSTTPVTNQDGIRYYGILSNGTTWANYTPPVDSTNALLGALLIFPYRGYLVFLNTTEGNELGQQTYGNRARWTQIGTPFYSLPTPQDPNIQGYDPKAVRDDLFGRGGANDAPTNESIVAAGFIKDILVVFFEKSTWRLRFVNNSQNPFVWERVNVELGADCTFSPIVFDQGLMAIGKRGIVISDGNNTARVDQKIPDEVFSIRQTNHGLQRVQGIRTFETRLNYWTIPSQGNLNSTYPDKVLIYNYETKNWSFFDDSFTCFGYVYPTTSGPTWDDLTNPWTSYNNQSAGDSLSQQGKESLIAGNQQGFVFQLEQTNGPNSVSLNISALASGVVTSNNHNLVDGDWVRLINITGTTGDDGVSLNNRNYRVSNPAQDLNTFTLNEYESISAGNALGTSFTFTTDYTPIFPGSVQINVGSIQFVDSDLDGVLYANVAGNSGTINYLTGAISLTFNPGLVSTPVIIRVVSLNPDQELSIVGTTGAYTGGGQIEKISNIEIQSKIFNFFERDQRARLSKIDFYTDLTDQGQITCNVFADSSNISVNTPLRDNPRQNIVLTTSNPYQIGNGSEAIYSLFCDCVAQTLQVQLNYSDRQMAVSSITAEDFQLLAMIFKMRAGGRLV